MVFESGEKPISLALSFSPRSGVLDGPGSYCRRFAGPPARLVSVTNDAACSPLDVIRYQLGRSSLTRAGAGTLARRDSAECSRYESHEESHSRRRALVRCALDDRAE